MGASHRPLMQAHPAGPYSTYRLFEWCMATMMVLIAGTLALPGDTMKRAALKPIAEMGFTEENMALLFGSVGAIRCLALFLNGHINNFQVGPKGAVIRAGCAAVGSLDRGTILLCPDLRWPDGRDRPELRDSRVRDAGRFRGLVRLHHHAGRRAASHEDRSGPGAA